MDTNIQLVIVLIILLMAALVALILVRNAHSAALKKDLEDINVRFNRVRTIPLAFKLNKAQAMAKINEETSAKVEEYYSKYEEAQKNIDRLQSLIEGLEDDIASKKYQDAKKALLVVKENLKDSEEEVKNIDEFLEQFSKQESIQREDSNRLKEEFRELKLQVEKDAPNLSIALEGIEEKLQACEEGFSSFEEWMYANEFVNAQKDLDSISEQIKDIKDNIVAIPECVKEAKGVLPLMMDELKRAYALASQRGVYLKHLDVEKKISDLQNRLNVALKAIAEADCANLLNDLKAIKNELKETTDTLNDEDAAFQDCKKALNLVNKNLNEVKRLYNYIDTVYHREQERYNLEDLKLVLDEQSERNGNYEKAYNELSSLIAKNDTPATLILKNAQNIYEATLKDIELLQKHKQNIDKTSGDEARAVSQVMKLQVVLNEVEVKIVEYRLPAISSSYKDDLAKGHEYIKNIKELLSEVPLRINILNTTLDEAIDYIYKLYNNVNNVVGMALMVENAIVFGNKYRSTYPEVDRELSRAEFAYLNGEYTQALTIAISCMESLFPQQADNKILENAKNAG